jgi:uncharacterized protein YPO0396
MNPTTLLQQPFIQITLPILIGFVAVGVWQNKRIDDFRADLKQFRTEVNTRFDKMEARFDGRFDRVDALLKNHGERIAVLEDRSSPLARR